MVVESIRTSVTCLAALARKLSYLFPMRPIALIPFMFLFQTVSAQEIALKHGSKTDRPGATRTVEKSVVVAKEDPVSVLIKGKLYDAIIIEGDTVAVITLPIAKATAKRVFKSKKVEKKYRRLVYHLKIVLPYAKLAGKRMKEVEAEVAGMSKRDRKRRMRLLEKEIKREYKGELTKMTFTQGRFLIKLLDRETGSISYDIVKEFRGGFTAWFFQGIAKLFDYDLKTEYDPEGKDRLIERIVQQIERGEL